MICIAGLVVIGFGADILNDYKQSKILEFIFDTCMRVCLVLAFEILILLGIEIYRLNCS